MSWKDKLRPASLGVAKFHTADRKASGGKRLVNHEYPKRDANFPEEMGLATRKWSVDAYCIGDDYMSARDKLIGACEKKGGQSYTDHWGRSGVVQVETWAVIETSHEGRYCKISLELVNAPGGGAGGLGGLPIGLPATASLLSSAAGGLKIAALGGFAGSFAGPAAALSGVAKLGGTFSSALSGFAGLATSGLARGVLSGLPGIASGPLGTLRAGLSRGLATTQLVSRVATNLGSSFTFKGR